MPRHSQRPHVPHGTWTGVDPEVRHIWYSREEELDPLPEPGEWGPLWTDNSRLDERITGQQLVAQLPGVLRDRELLVLELRLKGETLKEIGRRLGVNVERARQIEAKALVKIRGWCLRTRSLGLQS